MGSPGTNFGNDLAMEKTMPGFLLSKPYVADLEMVQWWWILLSWKTMSIRTLWPWYNKVRGVSITINGSTLRETYKGVDQIDGSEACR